MTLTERMAERVGGRLDALRGFTPVTRQHAEPARLAPIGDYLTARVDRQAAADAARLAAAERTRDVALRVVDGLAAACGAGGLLLGLDLLAAAVARGRPGWRRWRPGWSWSGGPGSGSTWPR